MLVGLAAAVGVQRLAGPSPTAAPIPTASSTPTPAPAPAPTTPPSAEPVPTGTSTPPARVAGPRPEGIDALADQVAALRGLPLDAPLDARVLSPAALADKFADLAFSELLPDEVERDRRLLVALRLVPTDVDLLGIVEALFREQLLGLYVPEEDVLYVGGEDVTLSAYQRVTAAHEVTHALQDRAYDLESMLDLPEREADASLAIRSLVEGDAVVVQERWAAEHQDTAAREAALAEARARTSASLASAPDYIVESISFPYAAGTRFVLALLDAGGPDVLEAAFADPPTTSSEILHPERYLDGEAAEDVSVAGEPGAGWEAAVTYSFGEFDLDHLLRPLGRSEARALAAGWAGGEVRAWRRDGDDAVAIVLALRTPEDAAALCEAAPRWYAATTTGVERFDDGLAGPDDAFSSTCGSTHVRLAVAPDRTTATVLVDP